MVLTLADVYSNEDVYSIVMFHRVHATSRYTRSSNGQQLTAAGLGIHVTDGLRFPRTKSLSAITSHPPSSVTPRYYIQTLILKVLASQVRHDCCPQSPMIRGGVVTELGGWLVMIGTWSGET